MTHFRDEGFVLVAVLWILAALAALASAFSVFAARTTASVYLPEERIKANSAIRAAIELTAYRQLAWPIAARPSQGDFNTRLGGATLNVVYRAESARVDINAAPRSLLVGLFAQLGASSSNAGLLADRIIGWRKRGQASTVHSEVEAYHKAGLGYAPAGAPFDNVLELAALPDMSPQLLSRALPYLTVYNSAGVIDPAIAPPAVLASIPGMTPAMRDALRSEELKPHPDLMALSAIAGPGLSYLGVGVNDTVRAEIIVSFPTRQITAEIVILITPTADEPFQILYWRNDYDG